jgi:hypothetical protein
MDDRTELADKSVGGTGLAGTGRPSRTFRNGRICAEHGCETKLSIYNDDEYCSLHVSPSTPRLRGKKIA